MIPCTNSSITTLNTITHIVYFTIRSVHHHILNFCGLKTLVLRDLFLNGYSLITNRTRRPQASRALHQKPAVLSFKHLMLFFSLKTIVLMPRFSSFHQIVFMVVNWFLGATRALIARYQFFHSTLRRGQIGRIKEVWRIIMKRKLRRL